MIETRDLPIESVHPNPNQPRQQFDEKELQELADSIKAVGLVTPILVRPDGDDSYEIVHGERRWRAHQLAGLETIRAEIRTLTDSVAYTLSLIENEQRQDLSPIETAAAIHRMMETENLTQAAAARRISRSRDWVAQKLRLLNLPEETQDRVKAGKLTEGHARQLLKLRTVEKTDQIDALAERAIEGGWSVSRLESEVNVTIIGVSQDTPKPLTEKETEHFKLTVLPDRYTVVYRWKGQRLDVRADDWAELADLIGNVSCDTLLDYLDKPNG